MYCPQCGAKIEDNDKFCKKCGKNLSAAATPPAVIPLSPISPKPPAKANGAVAFVILMIIIGVVAAIVYHTQINNNNSSTNYSDNSSPSPSPTPTPTPHVYCNPGNTYNYSSGMCCPNNAPHYYNGAHGIYQAGCYQSCPYLGDCSEKTTRY